MQSLVLVNAVGLTPPPVAVPVLDVVEVVEEPVRVAPPSAPPGALVALVRPGRAHARPDGCPLLVSRNCSPFVARQYGRKHIPPDLVVRGITAHRKPPDVRIWRLSNQSRVGTVPPSTSTPHWPACWARR